MYQVSIPILCCRLVRRSPSSLHRLSSSHPLNLDHLLAVNLGNDVGIGAESTGLEHVELGNLDEEGLGGLGADKGRQLLDIGIRDVAAEEDNLGSDALGDGLCCVAAQARGGGCAQVTTADNGELRLSGSQVEAGVDDCEIRRQLISTGMLVNWGTVDLLS